MLSCDQFKALKELRSVCVLTL